MNKTSYAFTRDWEGLTAVVLGNGPSLLGRPLPGIDGPRVRSLVSNGGYVVLPKASVLMCSDRNWLKAHPDLSGYEGPFISVTQPQAVVREDPRMHYTKRAYINDMRGDIFADPALLVEGHNSTSTNISLSVLRGVSRIILLGVDLSPGQSGRRRTYDKSTDDPAAAKVRYEKQVVHLTMQAKWVRRRGIEVINCSPPSMLRCYPMGQWEDLCNSL